MDGKNCPTPLPAINEITNQLSAGHYPRANRSTSTWVTPEKGQHGSVLHRVIPAQPHRSLPGKFFKATTVPPERWQRENITQIIQTFTPDEKRWRNPFVPSYTATNRPVIKSNYSPTVDWAGSFAPSTPATADRPTGRPTDQPTMLSVSMDQSGECAAQMKVFSHYFQENFFQTVAQTRCSGVLISNQHHGFYFACEVSY